MISISVEAAAQLMDVPDVWVSQMILNGQLTDHSDGQEVAPSIDELAIRSAGWSALPVAPYRHSNDFMVQLGLRILH